MLAAISFQILFVFGFFGNASVNLPTFAAVLLDSLVFWFLRCWCLTGKVFEVLVPNRKGPGRPQTKKTKESKSTAAKVGKLIEAFPKKQKKTKSGEKWRPRNLNPAAATLAREFWFRVVLCFVQIPGSWYFPIMRAPTDRHEQSSIPATIPPFIWSAMAD